MIGRDDKAFLDVVITKRGLVSQIIGGFKPHTARRGRDMTAERGVAEGRRTRNPPKMVYLTEDDARHSNTSNLLCWTVNSMLQKVRRY